MRRSITTEVKKRVAVLTTFVVLVSVFALAPQTLEAQSCEEQGGKIVRCSGGQPVCRLPDQTYQDVCPDPVAEIVAGNPNTFDLLGGVSLGVVNTFLGGVGYLLYVVSSLLLGLAGVMLNFAIDTTVRGMADFIGNISAITIAWEVLRDVANTLFIFLILLIAIGMIVNSSRFGDRKLLIRIVVAALLINFSLFFTRVVIDASNILAYEFYKPVLASLEQDTADADTDLVGFSAAFMEKTGLIKLISGEITGSSAPVSIFMTSIFVLIAAFVFFAVALLLIIRFIILVFLLVTSPIAFVGGLLPGMKDFAKDWWGKLFDQAFFPVIFFLLASISFAIISDPNFLAVTVGRPEEIARRINTPEAVDILGSAFNFIIVIGFLVTALVASKTMAKNGGGKMVDWATRTASWATFGTTSFLARETVGRAGKAIADSDYLKSVADRGGPGGLFARGLLKGGDSIQKSSLDLRGVVGGGIDAGKPPKGGFKKTFEEREKREKDYEEGAARYRATKERVHPEETLRAQKEIDNLRRQTDEARKAESDAAGFAKPQRTADRIQLEDRLAEAERKLSELRPSVGTTEAERDVAQAARTLSDEELLKVTQLIQIAKDKDKSPGERRAANETLSTLQGIQKTYVDAVETLDRLQKTQKGVEKAALQGIATRGLSSAFPEKRAASREIRKGKDPKQSLIEAAEKFAKAEKGEGSETLPPEPKPGDEGERKAA